MCRCKVDVWEDGPDEPIYERFSDPQVLLDSVATYYPKQYDEMNLDQAQLIGTGADANVYYVNGEVVKFTQNREHAKVSWKLAQDTQQERFHSYLVHTSNVGHLPDLGLWCITEERLNSLTQATKGRLDRYFNFGEEHPYVSSNIDCIVRELDRLGVREWGADCVSPHNLMVNPLGGDLVAFDFGHTHTHFPEDYPVWS